MIFAWEALALLSTWTLVILGGAIWIERRLSSIERDIMWLTQYMTRQKRGHDEPR